MLKANWTESRVARTIHPFTSFVQELFIIWITFAVSWTPGVTLGVRTHTRARVCTQTHESVRRHASAVNASLHLTRVIRDSAVQRSRRGFMAVRCSTDRSSSPLALLRQPRVPRHPSHGHREAIAASLASSLLLIPSGRSLFPLPPPPPPAGDQFDANFEFS